MPEGTQPGQVEQVPTKAIIYVGTMLDQEIAATGQLARFGEPIEVENRSKVVRHVLDDHGNRYQDVTYPGVADQLLQRPDFIEAGEGVKVEEQAEQVRALESAGTGPEKLALTLAAEGAKVDAVVMGEPGYVVVPQGTPAPGPADTGPQEPASMPQTGQHDVQPNPPVNLQPAAPGDQTGTDPDSEIVEGDATADKQKPGRARPRTASRSATRRG